MSVDDKSEAIRDAIFSLIHISLRDHEAAIASLHNSDDIGFRHHAKRIFDSVRLVHKQLKELEGMGANDAGA